MKKILYITLTVVILGGSFYLAAFAGAEQGREKYRSFSLRIENPQEHPLITEEELNDTLLATFGKIEGRSLESAPLYDIENFLGANPYVATTNVYSTLTGGMSASVTVRVPLLRIINSFNESFFLDTAGVAMPVSRAHPIRLLVASGNITEPFRYSPSKEMSVTGLKEGSVIRDLYRVAGLIASDELLNAMISQIYVTETYEFELVPRLGNQVILFGTGKDASAKLEKLKAFYLQVVRHAGWDTYKTINLKFENQVVCSK